jgi:hypothetical protein
MISHTDAVIWHEAGFRLAAAKLDGIVLRATVLDAGLRRCSCDVINYDVTDDGSAEVCERMSATMLTGRAR